MIKKLLIAAVMVSSLCVNACLAQSVDEVRKFVQLNTEQILDIINSASEEKDDKLTKMFEDVVDSNWMARFAIGAEWRNLDDHQQVIYLKAYSAYLLKIYLPKFEQYHATKYDIRGIEELGNDQFIVHMTVDSPSEAPIKLDYRIKCEEGKCYIRDLIAEEVSMVASQRADFTAVINNSGIDGLLRSLEQKSGVRD